MRKINFLSIIDELVSEKYPLWLSNLENRFLPAYVWRSDLLTRWRERILFVICFISTVFGPVALIPSLVLAYTEKRWDVIILDSFSYSMAVAILLARRVPLNVRAWSACLTLYLLGIGLLFMLGSLGAGYIWLFGASVMAGALLGLRASLFALMMNLSALIAIGIYIAVGHPDWPATPSNALEKWLIMALNFMLLNTIVTLTIAVMLSGLQRALSKEQKMSHSLRQSEERFRAAFHTSPDSIIISRLSDGLCVDVNDGFTRIMGHSRDEFIGRPSRHLNTGDDSEDRWQLVQELSAKGIVNNKEVRFRAKNNQVKTGLMSASVLDYNGVPHILSVIRDVTAIKETEKQLQQARKMEAIGILAGGIAHDFNNLLQIINGYAQILSSEKHETDPDYPKLMAIEKAVGNAAQLVRQLLTFSRKAESKFISLDLNREISHVRKILARTLPKMIDIHLHLGESLPHVAADPVQIEQLLLNLGSNAADAMPEGGMLRIETENVKLNEAFLASHPDLTSGDCVLLTITDTGHGMDQKTVERSFEPFFTTKEVGKGTGLGLASVYGIIKSHGGHISCKSQPGQGTTFKLYLPAVEQREAVQEKCDDAIASRGGSETILLVDDEESIRTFAATVLERFGYTVLTCARGEDAIAIIFRGGKIDLVILDLGMPGMGGHKCLKEILKIDPSAKILLASGYAINGQAKKSLESGAAGYIGKPYQIKGLIQKVREILDNGQ
jgi:two-component system, cell cycle sensor histidine kinase and response regulator CckA